MAAAAGNRSIKLGKPSGAINWLDWLDGKISALRPGSDWFNDSELALQRCRRFIMVRFPELPRLLPDQVLCDELSRGEERVRNSDHADWILRDLKPDQRNQLAALLIDVTEALEFYVHHGHASKSASKLAAEHNRRKRMLLRKVSKIRCELELLLKYAEDLHPLLGLKYVRETKRCLKSLANLKESPFEDDVCRSLKAEYQKVEDPRQLGMVELYCFFRYECRCSGPDSEVRVGMLASDFLASTLKYIPKYDGAESQGCPAVRIAVSRWCPRTTN